MQTDLGPPESPPQDSPKLQAELKEMRRWMIWLTAAVFLVAVVLLLEIATIFGYIVDFHAGESKLVAGACAGGVAMGFLFGWLARRAAGD